MEKSSNLFIKIDEFIFQKLDALKSEGVFQKFNDALANLDEDQQKIVAQVTTFTLIIIPFIFVAVLWWGNSQSRKAIETKKQIMDQIALFDGNKNTLNNISANYLAPSSIMGQDDLDNRMRNILSQSSIDQTKVNISNFTQNSISSSINKTEAELVFQGFGTSDFSNFMRALVDQERFKILKINLNKNNETNLLQGTISLMHMGPNLNQ
ncbi:hypothetical protein DOM21_11470 [Bacteriovorax stolpii]|uniref:Uncharacterized protein n=1 Tax=Bacteriovorax stolpii TaxID=960 RepID=A0A2K9NR23_BACTC|nr:hypothetical protein [Bacteriovorax stolpii]AUN97959.1 hypothetical protein C0V70_07530 [Bacteriovorax stolpii]QDK42055.1 hypothetical protein DOM21_11470 [Bacteriovorax stolpii]TDP51792.1 hypothetical protein C8D79_3239 [Bacteriovorax stolpii]